MPMILVRKRKSCSQLKCNATVPLLKCAVEAMHFWDVPLGRVTDAVSLRRLGCHWTKYISTSFVDAYAQWGRVDCAGELFDKMTVTWFHRLRQWTCEVR